MPKKPGSRKPTQKKGEKNSANKSPEPKPKYWIPKPGKNGMNELHYAAYCQDPAGVKYWIGYGFDVNKPDHNWWTPLVWAIDMNQTGKVGACEEIIDILMAHGAAPILGSKGVQGLLDLAKERDPNAFRHLKKAIKNAQWHMRYGALLRIKSCGQFHREIKEKTGLRPSHQHLKGTHYPDDMWILESRLNEKFDLRYHVDSLWQQIEPHKAYFKKLLSRHGSAELYLTIYGKSNMCPTIEIDRASFKIFQELPISINISPGFH